MHVTQASDVAYLLDRVCNTVVVSCMPISTKLSLNAAASLAILGHKEGCCF